jgi:hypothetical protein
MKKQITIGLLIFLILIIAVGQVEQDHILTALVLTFIAYLLTNKLK